MSPTTFGIIAFFYARIMVLHDIVDVGAVCMAIDKSGKCKGCKSGKRKKRPRNH